MIFNMFFMTKTRESASNFNYSEMPLGDGNASGPSAILRFLSDKFTPPGKMNQITFFLNLI